MLQVHFLPKTDPLSADMDERDPAPGATTMPIFPLGGGNLPYAGAAASDRSLQSFLSEDSYYVQQCPGNCARYLFLHSVFV